MPLISVRQTHSVREGLWRVGGKPLSQAPGTACASSWPSSVLLTLQVSVDTSHPGEVALTHPRLG